MYPPCTLWRPGAQCAHALWPPLRFGGEKKKSHEKSNCFQQLSSREREGRIHARVHGSDSDVPLKPPAPTRESCRRRCTVTVGPRRSSANPRHNAGSFPTPWARGPSRHRNRCGPQQPLCRARGKRKDSTAVGLTAVLALVARRFPAAGGGSAAAAPRSWCTVVAGAAPPGASRLPSGAPLFALFAKHWPLF